MLALSAALPWPANVHLGVTVETHGLTRGAPTRCAPCRPRCGTSAPSRCSGRSTSSTSRAIDWVIAGGESGPTRRPPRGEWLRGLRDHCLAAGVAFTFKGWGGRVQGAQGRLLDGREWHERPPRTRHATSARATPTPSADACGVPDLRAMPAADGRQV